MKDALDRINELELWDFEIAQRDGGRLLILGSNDFDYYHSVEIEFHGVTFCDLPDTFSHAEFSFDGPSTIRVNAEGPDSLTSEEFEIRATGLQVRVGTVYYYERENLQPGERIDNKRRS